jgi:hypothetical protein
MSEKKKIFIKPASSRPSEEKKARPAPSKGPAVAEHKSDFAFGKENYKLLLIGLGLIVLGFLLMIGGGSKDPKVFSYSLFDFQRITLAPVLVLAGYVVEIFAIMKKPKD